MTHAEPWERVVIAGAVLLSPAAWFCAVLAPWWR